MASAFAANALTTEEPSRYQRAVLALQSAEQDWKVKFAEAAISQLAEVYLAEADLATFQAGPDRRDFKLSGWSRAVEQYANQLLLVEADARQGASVEVYAETLGPPRLVVGGRSVILSHPREDQQTVYEHMVYADFCRRLDCDVLVPPDIEPAPQPIPLSAPAFEPEWRFAGDKRVCEGSSISVVFGHDTELERIKLLCSQLLHELSTLRNDLLWQQRHGVVLESRSLTTQSVPGRPVHLVTLNARGDTLLLELPLLHNSPGLMRDVSDWLLPRSGKPRAPVTLEAKQYGWQ